MNACDCAGEGCSNPAVAQDRNGIWWCSWCHENGVCTDGEGHYPEAMSVPISPEKHFTFSCPECEDMSGFAELIDIEAISHIQSLMVTDGEVDINWIGSTEILDQPGRSLGVMCTSCGWTLRDKGWRNYVLNYEEREKERIRREFMKEAGLLDEGEVEDVDEHPISNWEVPLIPGKIQIVIPVTGHSQPVVMEVDMNELDGPQDIHIDPHARTVSLKTKEPLIEVEVCRECDAEVPAEAISHEGDWHEGWCSLHTDNIDSGVNLNDPGPRGQERSRRALTMAGDAPELVGTRKFYVYVTDKDMTQRLSQTMEVKRLVLDRLGGINWNSDDHHDGAAAVSFDVPNNIPDDDVFDLFADIGMTAEAAS